MTFTQICGLVDEIADLMKENPPNKAKIEEVGNLFLKEAGGSASLYLRAFRDDELERLLAILKGS